MKLRTLGVLTILSFSLVVSTALVWAGSSANASIYNFEGRSTVMRSGRAILSQTDLPLKPGDVIKTQKDSFLDLVLNGVAGIKIYENATLKLINTAKSEMKLSLLSSKAMISVNPLDNGVDFEIETPTMIAKVRGTQFLIKIEPEGNITRSTLVLLKGAIDVSIKNANSTVVVKEGQSIDTFSDGRITPARSMTEEELEEMEAVKTIYIPESGDNSSN